jgi:AraC-like DNA-binding protein
MKPVYVPIHVPPEHSFVTEHVRTPGGSSLFNYHIGYQFTLVLKGRGQRFVGDSIAPYEEGDLAFVGPYLPHMWREDDLKRSSHSLLINFEHDALGADFFKRPEMSEVRALLERSRRGLRFHGRTLRRATELVIEADRLTAFARVIAFLELLGVCAAATDTEPLASPHYSMNFVTGDEDRLSKVFRHINANLGSAISRSDLAKHVHLSESAFSRFFMVRVGRPLPVFVNELRVGRACRLLIETNRSVTEIAYECGYGNLANFNRQFLSLKKITPTEFRTRVRRQEPLV